MWRLLLVVVAIGVLVIACLDELSVEEDFVQIMEKTREGTFTVTFDFDAPEGSREPITWYRLGEFQRTDVEYIPGPAGTVGEPNQLMWVSGPRGTYVCSEIPISTTRDLAGCVREPTSAGFPDGPPAFLTTSIRRPDLLDVQRVESRTIAGAAARCFGIDATDGEGGELDVCLTSDGVPLYIELFVAAVEGSFTYTATSFSGEVPEGIFEPPMEIVGENPICAQLAC